MALFLFDKVVVVLRVHTAVGYLEVLLLVLVVVVTRDVHKEQMIVIGN